MTRRTCAVVSKNRRYIQRSPQHQVKRFKFWPLGGGGMKQTTFDGIKSRAPQLFPFLFHFLFWRLRRCYAFSALLAAFRLQAVIRAQQSTDPFASIGCLAADDAISNRMRTRCRAASSATNGSFRRRGNAKRGRQMNQTRNRKRRRRRQIFPRPEALLISRNPFSQHNLGGEPVLHSRAGYSVMRPKKKKTTFCEPI